MEVFRKWDINNDGRLSLDEFRKGMQATTKLSEAEIDEIFHHLDNDDNREITIDEFVMSCAYDGLVAADDRLRAAFIEMDVNNDGKLDVDELKRAMSKFQMQEIGRAESLIREIDTDGDGQIDVKFYVFFIFFFPLFLFLFFALYIVL